MRPAWGSADAAKVGDAFVIAIAIAIAVDEVDEGESAGEKIKAVELKKQLLMRAGRGSRDVGLAGGDRATARRTCGAR